MYEIIPAILVHHRQEYINQINQIKGLVDKVHIDIMDGKFVPNTSVALSQIGDIPVSMERTVHLMVQNPSQYLKKLEKYQINQVIVHYESFHDEQSILSLINAADFLNIHLSLAINPDTSETVLKDLINKIQSILVMTVVPGFSGQPNQISVLTKITRIFQIYPKADVIVDGGINKSNISQYYNAGVRKFSMNSAIFKEEPKQAIAEIKKILNHLENKQ